MNTGRKRLAMALVLIVLTAIPFSAALCDTINQQIFKGAKQELFAEKPSEEESVSFLPGALEVIEEGAFEGTSIANIVIPESVREIGESAFSNNSQLRLVTFLGDVRIIGDHAFDGSNFAALLVPENSHIQKWAAGNRIRYITGMYLKADSGAQAIEGLTTGNSHPETDIRGRTNQLIYPENEKRTGRASGELKADKGRRHIALYIRSRYFP